MTQVSTSGPADHASPNLLTRLFQAREASLLLILLALVAVTTAINPRFLSAQSLRDLALNVAIVALVVVGQTLVLLMKHVDLSVSSILGLTAFFAGSLFFANPGMPIWLSFLAGLVIGA